MAIDPPPNPLNFEYNAVRYMVNHYPDNSNGSTPDVWDGTLFDYECAKEQATELMANANNEGICVIIQMPCIFVYPPSPLQDGWPS